MAGIRHINNFYNPEVKRVSSKLSFQMGEIFSAKVIKLDENPGEILLKLLDGWHFSAKLDKPLDFSPKGQLKFQIIGMQDGKVIIKLLDEESKPGKQELDSLVNILSENNLNSEEYNILEKMLKHEMPLNKDNISKVKSISDFISKITLDSTEEDIFIDKYLGSKALEVNSDAGKSIKETLKNFFQELKSISVDDVLTMMENNIELNTENIASFKRVFKTEAGLYNNLLDIKQYFEREIPGEFTKAVESFKITQEDLSDISPKLNELQKDIKSQLGLDNPKSANNIGVYSNSTVPIKQTNRMDILKSLVNNDQDLKSLLKDIVFSDNKDLDGREIEGLQKLIKDFGKNEVKDVLTLKGIVKGESEELLQNTIGQKTKEVKEVIKSMLSISNGVDKEVFDKVIEFLKPTLNDIKIFNTINNQYYYMDIPINIKDADYPCKLIIKDERNRGKKIDSKNVNMVVSVKTVNLGEVDGFIKVRDNNVMIDIKCLEAWIPTFEASKDKLIENLSNLQYNFFINFEKKEKVLDISSCREFFNDNSFNTINVQV